jgi:hypothetical protein
MAGLVVVGSAIDRVGNYSGRVWRFRGLSRVSRSENASGDLENTLNLIALVGDGPSLVAQRMLRINPEAVVPIVFWITVV